MFIGEDVNFIAVLFSAIVSMALGFLWYSPILFGNLWMKLSGISDEKIKAKKKSMQPTYIISALTSLIMAYILGIFIDLSNALTIMEGIAIATIVWLGFVATTMLTSALYEDKDSRLYFINTGYQMVSLLLMGAILTLWQ